MSTTTQRPTPETDEVFDAYARCECGTACIRVRMQLLERERDEAREQLKAMREAIKNAHYALAYVYNHGEGSCAFPFRTEDDLCSENRFHHVKDAIDALQLFLKP